MKTRLGVSRMQFIRGDFKGNKTPIRPPWSVAENFFLHVCTQCGDCIDVCPTHIISIKNHYPIIDFSKGECLFCEACVDACKPHALKKADTASTNAAPWAVKAQIKNETCIAFKGTECRTCYDPCESRAIKMPPKIGGIATPSINEDDCNGCGACFITCPVQAVFMQQLIAGTTC